MSRRKYIRKFLKKISFIIILPITIIIMLFLSLCYCIWISVLWLNEDGFKDANDFIIGWLNDLEILWFFGFKAEYKNTISETGWLDCVNHRRWDYKIKRISR